MKKVELTFSAEQKAGSTNEKQAGNYKGTLRFDAGAYVLTYKESNTGTDVVIRIMADQSGVKTQRFAKHTNCLLIEKGKATRCLYKTDFGDMLLEVTGESITITENDGKICFAFSYDICQNGRLLTQNSVTINCKYLS